MDFHPDRILPLQNKMISIAIQYENETGELCPGLAAPQVGCNVRVIMIRTSDDPSLKQWTFMYNPVYVSSRDGFIHSTEGCMSVPNCIGECIRPKESLFFFQDERGNLYPNGDYLRVVDDDSARLCHLLDHLNGVLFTDNAVAVKRPPSDQLE
jgi:peptide deformylase